MEDFKKFLGKYLATRLYDLIIGIVVIVLGAFIGNYVQQNKEDVKIKLKGWIDKM